MKASEHLEPGTMDVEVLDGSIQMPGIASAYQRALHDVVSTRRDTKSRDGLIEFAPYHRAAFGLVA